MKTENPIQAPIQAFQTFAELSLPAPLLQSLAAMSFATPTPIQAKAIPAGLEGRDVIGTAQTGTGKTAAFSVPMLTALYKNPGQCALVLAPTRELAAQIHKVLRQLGKGSKLNGSLVVGGESFRRQADELGRGCEYVVATPGRLNDHLDRGTVDLSSVSILVLDEVDRMLDMGFLPQLKQILGRIPKKRQTMLFSATLPKEVTRFVDTLVNEPLRISVGDTAAPNLQITQTVRTLTSLEKNAALVEELKTRKGKVIVFVRTQSRTQRLERLLEKDGIDAVVLHGGRTQAQRKQALEAFRNGRPGIMLATDLAGRGIDIVDIDHVINYDVPATREDYIHRIGRTGRAGLKGEAVSFVEIGNRDEMRVVGIKPDPSQPTGRRVQTGPARHHGGTSRPHAPRSFEGRPARREEGDRRPRHEHREARTERRTHHAPRITRTEELPAGRSDWAEGAGPARGGSYRSDRHPSDRGGRQASSHPPAAPRREDSRPPRREGGHEDRWTPPHRRDGAGPRPAGKFGSDRPRFGAGPRPSGPRRERTDRAERPERAQGSAPRRPFNARPTRTR